MSEKRSISPESASEEFATKEMLPREGWAIGIDDAPVGHLDGSTEVSGIIESGEDDYVLLKLPKIKKMMVTKVISSGETLADTKFDQGQFIDLKDSPDGEVQVKLDGLSVARIGNRIWIDNSSKDIVKLTAQSPARMGGFDENGERAWDEGVYSG
jgi:hypothetical protein